MSDQTTKTGSVASKIRAWVPVLLAFGLAAGWLWAISDTGGPYAYGDVMHDVSISLLLLCMVIGGVAVFMWMRGRRQAEDKAERTGQSISAAQDAYDARPASLLTTVALAGLCSVMLFGSAPQILELVSRQDWLKAALAGLFVTVVAAGLFKRVLDSVRRALRARTKSA